MAAHRYWRLIGMGTRDGSRTLSLSALHLYAGASRVDAGATLTSTAPIVTGALANLQNATPGDSVVLDFAPPGAALVWDLGGGADAEITSLRIAGAGRAAIEAWALQGADAPGEWAEVLPVQAEGPESGGLAAWAVRPDPHWAAVVALLQFDDDTLLDATRRRVWGASGGVTFASGAPGFGRELSFPSKTVADYVSSPYTDDFNFGAGDVTIEAWVRVDDVMSEGACVVGCWGVGPSVSPHWFLGFGLDRKPFFAFTGSHLILASSALPAARAHLAYTRASHVHRIFINGVKVAEGTDSAAVLSVDPRPIRIGRWDSAYGYFNGSIDDLRITKGVARYTADFDAPAAPFWYPERAPRGRCIPPLYLRPNDVGTAQITGTLKKKDTPANLALARRVALYEERSRRLVAETWSDAVTGEYTFTGLDPALRYSAIGYDHEQHYSAVIADNLSPQEPA